MIVVQNRIPIAKGWEAEFEKRFTNRAWALSKLPGFVRNEVLRPAEGSDAPYIVRTYWETMAAFEAWTKSDEFRAAHANTPPKEAFSGPSKLEIHEVFSVHERPAADERLPAL